MTPLVELYEPENLPRVFEAGATLIGVNNRDLHTFEVDLEHTIRMRAASAGRLRAGGRERHQDARRRASGWRRPASTPFWSANR